ncbi:MAG TPA: ornithine cyclodeaminase family protein [Actinomycetota bacterium]|nr:ornithine cyclodeaminase family protein [Actinomycetota bacterium]
MLVLSRAEVEALLDPDRLIDALAAAMADLSAGRASVPNRVAAEVPEAPGALLAMPAFLPSAGALTTKLVSLFPGNTDRPTHQAVIACFDPTDGTPVALLDGTAITELRTAACSALATRLLAREDVRVLAVLGTGVQARAHGRLVPRVRRFERVVVAGRDRGKAEALARELSAELGVPAEAGSFEEAVRAADVVCACTHSPEPVVRRAWLRDGAHVTSVGFNTAGREVDGETVRDALVVVESREAALAPPPAGSNDLLWPIRDGLITADHVHAELGELVMGTKPGRTSPEQITLYKSVGNAVEDAAAAALVLAEARRTGAGTQLDLTGS